MVKIVDSLTDKHKCQADGRARGPSHISYVGDYHVGIVYTMNDNEGIVMG